MSEEQRDGSELLQYVQMRAAANRAAMISRQEMIRLVREIRQRQEKGRER